MSARTAASTGLGPGSLTRRDASGERLTPYALIRFGRSNQSRRSAVCGRRLDLPAGLSTQALFGTDRVNRPARVADIKADRPLVRRIRVALDRVLTVAAAADPGVSAGDDVRIRKRTDLCRGGARCRRAHDREHPGERTWAGCPCRTLLTCGTLRTCRTLRARDSLRTLRAWRAGIALWAWRAHRTRNSLRTLRADRAGVALRTLRTLRSRWTWDSLRTLGAGGAGVALRTLRSHRARTSLRTLRTDRSGRAGTALRTWRTCGTRSAGCACCSHRTSRSHRTWRTCGPWRTSGTGRTSGAWRTSGAGGTCGADVAVIALIAFVAFVALVPVIALSSLVALGTLGSGRTNGTSRTNRACQARHSHLVPTEMDLGDLATKWVVNDP